MSFGQTLYAKNYDHLHSVERPLTPGQEKKQAELRGHRDVEPGTISFDRPESRGDPSAKKYISTERKQVDIHGRYDTTDDVKALEAELHTSQMTTKRENSHGDLIVSSDPKPLPGRPATSGSPRVVSKGLGDRSSHIDCLPLPSSKMWADGGYNVLPVAPPY